MPATLEATHPPAARAERLYTGADLLNHPEWGPCELIRGKVVHVCRPNFIHGKLTTEMAYSLRAFNATAKLGSVLTGDSGVYLERNPDTVCGPDVYFISKGREPAGNAALGYLEVAPELCIEIVSPKDRWTKMQTKVDLYLKLGVKLVWLIDPKTRKAHVFRADKTRDVVTTDGVLSGEQVLPGFELPLKELFAALD